MKSGNATKRRGLFAALVAVGLPGLALVTVAEPTATGATDPCAASEVARTIGSVAKQTGDYLDSHPETNQAMTAAFQGSAGPQSFGSLKSYLEKNPKVASDLQSLSQPLTNLSTQCRLPITLSQAVGLAQAAQDGGALSGLPAVGLPLTPGNLPVAAGPLPGPAPANRAG
ncbi:MULTISPECIES: hemophore [Mycobacterium]|uniref:Exported protein n=5 Tax=Mycobacterium ulcerans group TaxID=2993898 RepID=B2HMX1_MYCMM|nr:MULTISPECIES: hemophore [Mycobacterium]ACC38910.1 exported protein [Mycobacterium marinum M]AXN42366.1 hypothetical protein MM1218R_00411 [Mycobacterium marinum]AXN47834.1 hypothetical protein CCUG20998_00410 [Mycobacterium marinum]EPQ44397.1 putative exported protein [Mycobacterium sp. 012931]EPQ71206.1 putative exported protein [Mycobacterium marinum MB2]